jgi:hypothetical protein
MQFAIVPSGWGHVSGFFKVGFEGQVEHKEIPGDTR